jgi:hypothetical protein
LLGIDDISAAGAGPAAHEEAHQPQSQLRRAPSKASTVSYNMDVPLQGVEHIMHHYFDTKTLRNLWEWQ